MGIFDDVVVNAKSAAQTVGKMAGQFVDMSKLRINMAELNGEITKRYQELGRFIYEAKKAGSADEAELADQIAGIDDLYAQLSAVSAQYASMQDKVTCPACGKKMPTDSMFCSHCGAKLENAPAEPEEAAEAVEKAEVPAEPDASSAPADAPANAAPQAEKKPAARPAPAPMPGAEATLPEGKKPSDVWNAALKRLAREAVACFAIINQGKFGGYAEGTYKLIFPRNAAISVDFVNAEERKSQIEKILTEEGGAPAKFEARMEEAVARSAAGTERDEQLLIDTLGRDKVQIDND